MSNFKYNIVMRALLIVLLSFSFFVVNARKLYVGEGQKFSTLSDAASVAQPGDAIVVLNGIYTQREDISNLNGEKDNPIIIYAEEEGKVIYSGQSEAWHLSSCTHLFIYGFVFEKQTANGVNIDDSGNYDGSTFDIIIRNCIFRDMNASGNNDLLKLSGLDNFRVEECTFLNGAGGGSGIDMVGCHNGIFLKNKFENMGSNCIQVKGGSQYIQILQNTFVNGGQRSLNLGGSTGLEYFRPQDAGFEAADILVRSNIFAGSWAPIAFVGSTRVQVINNTFYKPENWVFRILQETVDTSRFVACSYNTFSNNIVYFGNNLHRIVNIGPNTKPETFSFENNLWYNYENPEFDNPNLPATETGSIVQQDPLFVGADTLNFELRPGSPAIATGMIFQNEFNLDFKDRYYNEDVCIGAFQTGGIYKDFTGYIGTSWYYDAGSPDNYQNLDIEDKSIIQNKEVSNLVYYGPHGCVIFVDYFDIFTSNHKVWIKHRNEEKFEMAYDYNLKKDDFLYSITPYGEIETLVDTVTFEYLAGKVRKVFKTKGFIFYTNPNRFPYYFFGLKGKLIEGINSIYSFMFGTDQNNDRGELLRCFTYFDTNGQQFTEKFVDYACDSLTITIDPLNKNRVTLYPNPATNNINLHFGTDFSGDIEIIDITGALKYKEAIQSKRFGQIHLNNFKKGSYIIKITGNGFTQTKKFVIVK